MTHLEEWLNNKTNAWPPKPKRSVFFALEEHNINSEASVLLHGDEVWQCHSEK